MKTKNPNPIARDLHSPKYAKRVVQSKRVYKRREKHGGKVKQSD